MYGSPTRTARVLPQVRVAQLQHLAHLAGRPHLRARKQAPSNLQHALALQPVEVFGEAAAKRPQEVALDEEHEQRVQLVE